MEGQLRNQSTDEVVSLSDNCVIGRSQNSYLPLSDLSVSREHAIIRRQGNIYWLYDLDSYNGTLHNGKYIDSPVQLHGDDLIKIGDIAFVFEQIRDQSVISAESIEEDILMATQVTVERIPIIALVADIVGSCTLSDSLSEKDFALVMNSWYDYCRSLMQDNDGVIDKFLGDGMFGYWLDTSPSAHSGALQVAESLVNGSNEHREEVNGILKSAGHDFKCCVGIHCGTAVLGPVARGTRTVLGDAVNIAFRIESLTRNVGHSVLVSQDFLKGYTGPRSRFVSCGKHPLKGFRQTFELHGLQLGDRP
jgi:adenylate cyclase